MKGLKKILTLVFFIVSIIGYSQNTQEIINDLKKDLQSNPDEKKRAIIYSDLTWYYSNISIDSALVYGQKAINQSLKLGDSTIIAQAYGCLLYTSRCV